MIQSKITRIARNLTESVWCYVAAFAVCALAELFIYFIVVKSVAEFLNLNHNLPELFNSAGVIFITRYGFKILLWFSSFLKEKLTELNFNHAPTIVLNNQAAHTADQRFVIYHHRKLEEGEEDNWAEFIGEEKDND